MKIVHNTIQIVLYNDKTFYQYLASKKSTRRVNIFKALNKIECIVQRTGLYLNFENNSSKKLLNIDLTNF